MGGGGGGCKINNVIFFIFFKLTSTVHEFTDIRLWSLNYVFSGSQQVVLQLAQ